MVQMKNSGKLFQRSAYFSGGVLVFLMMLNPGLDNALGQHFLQNEYLKLEITDSGALNFTDKRHAVRWGSDFCGWIELTEGPHSEKISLSGADRISITVVPEENLFVIQFRGLNGKNIRDEHFFMEVSIRLDEELIEIEINQLKTACLLENLEYPAHLLSVVSGQKNGYIVAPHLQGILIPGRYDVGFMRYGQNVWDRISDVEKWWAFESGNLNMPWFGAEKDGSSVMAYVNSSSDCLLHLIGNAVIGENGFTVNNRQGQHPGVRLSSLSTVWLGQMKKFGYSRKISVELVDDGYVGMAKKYREYARESGRFVTLREKIRQNPEYEKIIGAPDIKIYCFTNRIDDPSLRAWSEPVLNGFSRVNTTFDQVGRIAGELKDMGVEKCMILLAGWNRMGYDRGHVDMWPPAEAAGGIQGLQQACKTVKKKGYLFALHDNYDDFYPDAPSYDEQYILRDYDGSIHLGGVWDGGLCHIICPVRRLELLQRNLGLIRDSVPLNGYYFDVLTSTSHYECYDERHRSTREEDLRYRLEMINYIRDQGLVIGGERGTDWAIPALAFCEGLSGGGKDYHYGITYQTGLTIPLFYLVYHECVVGYWQHGTPFGREDHANHVLLDLLNGQPSSWSIEFDQWNDLKPLIGETYQLLGKFHERTAHLEMTDHDFLTEDYMVQHTGFSNGTEIWVNFGIRTYTIGSFSLPPKGFRIQEPDEKIISGIAGRKITYLPASSE